MSEVELKDQLVIDDPVYKPTEEITIEAVESLPAKERQMAEKLGIKPEEKKEEPKVEKKPEPKAQSFEDTEKDEKNLVGNYNANEKALYWKWKHDKKERQEAQSRADHEVIKNKAIEKKLSEAIADGGLSKSKLDKVEALLSGPADQITVEALQGILKSSPSVEDEKPLTKKDLEDIESKKEIEAKEMQERNTWLNNRMAQANEYFKESVENYQEIIDAAQEVLEGKVKLPSYLKADKLSTDLVEVITNKDNDFDTIAEFVSDLAQLNPNFGKKEAPSGGNGKKESQENIDKIIKNASKQQSSAAVTSGSGRRVISYDELTLEDAARLSTDQWAKVPPHIKRKLLTE